MIVLSPDGGTLAQGVYGGEVRLFDVDSGTIIGALGPMRTIHSEYWATDIASAAFAPDGRTLAVGSNEDVVYLWDVESRARIGVLLGDVDQVGAGADDYRPLPVRPLLFSADGRTLAAASPGGKIRLWDLAAGTTTATIASGHRFEIGALSFSADGGVWPPDRLPGSTSGTWRGRPDPDPAVELGQRHPFLSRRNPLRYRNQ